MENLHITLFGVIFTCILLVSVAAPLPSEKPAQRQNNKDTVTVTVTEQKDLSSKSQKTTVTPDPVNKTECQDNKTDCVATSSQASSFGDLISNNKGMLLRTMYVIIGITGVVVLYFVIKTIRLRRRKSKSKKYGVISSTGQDNLEMTPLDQDDDDEDMTVFEINNGHTNK